MNDVDRFFALARDPSADLAGGDMVVDLLKRIAAQSLAAARFRRELAAVNDPEHKAALRDLVKRVAVGLEHEAAEGENWVDTIDRYIGTGLAGTAVASGIAIATGAFVAAPVVFAVSIVSLTAAGAKRYLVKRDANADKKASKLVLQLLD